MKKVSFRKTQEWTREILKNYFIVEGNTLTAELYYDTFAELIDQSMGNDKVEKLNETLFDKINEILALVPRKYQIHFSIHIKNLGEYEFEEVEQILKRNLMLKIYGFTLERKRRHITSLSLLLGGVLLLLASYFLSRLEWPQLIFDVINISGTLLVWEAADVSLIERNEEIKKVKQYVKKVKGIHLVLDPIKE
ncbi:MAG: hypothetical protein K2K48_04450 [Anaeroplasmataceae bacterium]|nr:hypothetical protein [Anaeroplasmataceae bacterium]MDE6414643.1 hypothetical protein [Anaeroplasmataceae bacterium]